MLCKKIIIQTKNFTRYY